MDLPLRCRCGAIRGKALAVSPASGARIVCHCDDCQAYARWLGGDDILDAYGGSEVFQMPLARLRFDEGREHARSVRLSDRGMVRWYAGCCRTPIGNTMPSPRIPFVGLFARFVDADASGVSRDEALGPAAYVQGRFAIGAPPPHVHPRATLRVIARSLGLVLRWSLAGLHAPSPFRGADGELLSPPDVLAPEERARLAPSASR